MAVLTEGNQRQLVDAARRGERDAFRALFETFKDRVYSIPLRFTGDESLAMDIAQDVFVKLFASIGEFRGDAAFATWVYRLAGDQGPAHPGRSSRVGAAAGDL